MNVGICQVVSESKTELVVLIFIRWKYACN